MTKETGSKPASKPAAPRDALNRGSDSALTEQDLAKVAGGARKAGEGQKE